MTISQRKRFIPFNIGDTQYYIDRVTSKKIDEEEFQEITTSNYEKDKKRGYEDRMAGYYDKWYRYNRLDDGKAYDEGVLLAANSENCPEDMEFIHSL